MGTDIRDFDNGLIELTNGIVVEFRIGKGIRCLHVGDIDSLNVWSKGGLIEMTNGMLDQLHVPNHVTTVDQINADVFVLLYEGLCGEQLPDVIHQPIRYEDEAHNCQVVIDALSMDVLHSSLSHITGEEVASADRTAINNLLEIFSGLMEYILKQIESDISDADGDGELEFEDDPDALTPDVIDGILERELRQSRSSQRREAQKRAHIREIVGEQKERSPERESVQENNQSVPAPATWEKTENGHAEQRGGRTGMTGYVSQDSRRLADSGKIQEGAPHRAGTHRTNLSDDQDRSMRGSVLETTESLIREGERIQSELDTRPTRDTDPVTAVYPLYSQSAEETIPEISPPKKMGRDAMMFDCVGRRPLSSALTNERPGDQRTEDVTSGAMSALRGATSGVREVNTGAQGAMVEARGVTTTKPMLTSDFNYSEQPGGSRGHMTQPGRPLPSDLSSSILAAPVTSRGAPMGVGLRSTAPSHLFSSNRENRAMHATGATTRSTSYENLTAFVEETVKMSRDAVSPERGTATSAKDKLLSKAIRERLVQIERESDEITQLASSLNLPPRRREFEQGRPLSHSLEPSSNTSTTTNMTKSPTKSQRKVCFVTEKPSKEVTGRLGPSSPPTKGGADSPIKSSLRRYYENRSQRRDRPPIRRGRGAQPPSQSAARPPSARVTHKPPVGHGWRTTEKGYGSDGDIETLSDQLSDSDLEARYPNRYDALLLEDLDNDDHVIDGNANADRLLNQQGAEAVNDLRKQIQAEDKKAKNKAEFLRQLYEHDLEDYREELQEQTTKDKKTAKQTDKEYKKKVLTGPKAKSQKVTGAKKGTGLIGAKPRCRLGVAKPRCRPGMAKPKTRRRSASASPTLDRRASPLTVGEQDDVFSMLYEEFPYLHLSSETWHELWRQGIQQIERLTRAQQEVKTRKSRAQVQLEEAERRQEILMNIMKKELAHTQRMREVKARRDQQVSVRNKLHERRTQSARSRKYYDEYQVRSRAKMLKRRTKEEMIFKKLFRDGLDIQKERIQELRRYAKEQREIKAKERQNEIDSMENYYKDQFDMLANSVTRERENQVIRERAQAKVLDQMKKELRKKMEREIEDYQDQLFRDEDDTYFRQLDADRLKQELHMAKYNVRV